MPDAKTPPIPKEIQKLSFEEALKELESIVAKLEGGDVALEESIDIYSRGTQLKAHCEAKLKAAQAKVEKLIVGSDGKVKAEAADLE